MKNIETKEPTLKTPKAVVIRLIFDDDNDDQQSVIDCSSAERITLENYPIYENFNIELPYEKPQGKLIGMSYVLSIKYKEAIE